MDLNKLGQKSFQEFTHEAPVFCQDPASANCCISSGKEFSIIQEPPAPWEG